MPVNKDTRQARQIPIREIADALDKQISGADEQRAKGLSGLSGLRTARNAGLARDHARLVERLGPDHPRVAELAARIAVNTALAQSLSTEAARARTEPVLPEKQTWTLHGRVLDTQLRGAPDLTVALYNERGIWYEAAGHSCTDGTGYFQLRSGQTGQASAGSAGVTPGATSDSRGSATTTIELHAHVTDAEGKTLAADPRVLTPELGRVDYIEIVLGDAPADCAPPKGSKRPAPKAATKLK